MTLKNVDILFVSFFLFVVVVGVQMNQKKNLHSSLHFKLLSSFPAHLFRMSHISDRDSELKRQIFDLRSLEFMLPQPSLHVLTALGCLSHVNVAFVQAPPPHPSGLLGNRQACWETKAKRFSGQKGGRRGGGMSHAGVASSST